MVVITNKLTGDFLLSLPTIEVYKLLLDGAIVRFPNRFWVGNEALARSIEIIKYLVEDILKWDELDLRERMSIRVFKEHKLLGMLNSMFEGSAYLAVENAYPGKYPAYKLANVPRNYWNQDTVAAANRWATKRGTNPDPQTVRKLFRSSQSRLINKRGILGVDDIETKATAKLIVSYTLHGEVEIEVPNELYAKVVSRVPKSYTKDRKLLRELATKAVNALPLQTLIDGLDKEDLVTVNTAWTKELHGTAIGIPMF